jgi:hypothetical protein
VHKSWPTGGGHRVHYVEKSSIGCAVFWNEQSLPSLFSVLQLRKETRCPTINQVSRVKIQIRSPASRVKTQIKNPASRHRIPAKAASPATRNKKQTARFGGPFYFGVAVALQTPSIPVHSARTGRSFESSWQDRRKIFISKILVAIKLIGALALAALYFACACRKSNPNILVVLCVPKIRFGVVPVVNLIGLTSEAESRNPSVL